jgi:hypothetical protein
MDIENPVITYDILTLQTTSNDSNSENSILSLSEFKEALDSGSDIYWLGYNTIDNHDEMFKLAQVDGNYNTSIDYYKKFNGLWTYAEELAGKNGYYLTKDTIPFNNKAYYVEDNDIYTEVTFNTGESFIEGVEYYEKYGPRGNVAYYTWDTTLLYYRENCEYKKVENLDKYNSSYPYFYHEKLYDEDEEIERKI